MALTRHSSSTMEHGSFFDRAWDKLEGMMDSFVRSIGSRETRTSSNHNHKSSSPSNTRSSSQSPQDASSVDNEALVLELTLRLLFSVTSGYLLLWLTRKFLSPNGLLEDDGTTSQTPVTLVQQRLLRILDKRHQQQQETSLTRSQRKQQQQLIQSLTHHERQMAEEIVDPDDITQSFADIGGLDATKQELYELAILPLVEPHLFQSQGHQGHAHAHTLVQPVKGVLLYGRPGTGKTMLAKALAKEAHAIFLPLQLSKILNKWVGESNKLIAATFSLAHKLQPAVIFIDELDTFLKANTTETAYLDTIKSEFLTLWDGVATSAKSHVLVLGATNKPHCIDPAILRRMPRAFQVPLPDTQGRLAILSLYLCPQKKETNTENSNDKSENTKKGPPSRNDNLLTEDAKAFVPELARLTHGYSGSDLKELCKAAAMIAIQERTAEISRHRVMGLSTRPKRLSKETVPLRPISKDDLELALHKVKRSGAAAQSYGESERREQARQSGTDLGIDAASLQGLARLLRSLSSIPNDGPDVAEDEDDDGIPQLF